LAERDVIALLGSDETKDNALLLVPDLESVDLRVTVSAGALVELLVLLLIVHLLKAAQRIYDENKAFV
jgi:hypothetical protein